MVVEIRKQKPSTIWLTGAPIPCMSIYTPFYFSSSEIIAQYYQEEHHWKSWNEWQRRAMHDYTKAHLQLENFRTEKELFWVNLDRDAINENNVQKLNFLSENAIQESDKTLQKISNNSYSKNSSLLFRLFWKKQNLSFQ
jgi:dipeptidase